MKYVVCLKQIPRQEDLRFTSANRLVRAGADLVVNPTDLHALGWALALRDERGGEVVAVTMGPPASRAMLNDALDRGADRAIHLTDKRLAGADTLATARAIARALAQERPDVVLFGRSTLDGGTAQVGPQVAELLQLPQLTQVTRIATEGDTLVMDRETEREDETWTCATPLAVSVDRGPVPPTGRRRPGSRIDEITAEQLGGTLLDYGTRGSPTVVRGVTPLSAVRAGERPDDLQSGLDWIVARAEADPRPHARTAGEGRTNEIWVVAERDGRRLHPVSLEGLACAHAVAEDLDAAVVAVLLCDEPADHPATLTAHGADRVLVVQHPALAAPSTAASCAALNAALDQGHPLGIVGPWTAQGRDYLPRVAARRGLGLTGDVTRLETGAPDSGGAPSLLWVKPAWGAAVEAPISSRTVPAMGTLRPGVIDALPADAQATPAVTVLTPELVIADEPVRREHRESIAAPVLLDAAKVVVLVGPTLSPEELGKAEQLAGALGGAIGATSAAVAAGLAAPQSEVAAHKRSLSPRLAIAVGVDDPAALDPLRTATRLVTVHAGGAWADGRADLAVTASPAEFLDAALDRIRGDEPAVRPRAHAGRRRAAETDVIVVGGRLAGCAAAIPLARAGRRVVSLDRAAFPSDTVSTHSCVTGHTYEFAQLGVLDRLLAYDPPLLKWIVVGNEHAHVRERMPPVGGYDFGLSIRRSEMDVAFRETAIEAGAELREQTMVKGIIWERGRAVGVRYTEVGSRQEHELRAPLVIGADGRNSAVAGMVDAKVPYRSSENGRGFAYWYMEDPKVGTDWHETLAEWRVGPGVSLTVGMPEGRMIHMCMGPIDRILGFRDAPEETWEWWQRDNPLGAERIAGATILEGPVVAPKLPAFYRRSSGPGWALCGDAGHFKDPFIGQGIRDAVRFSRLLGERVAPVLDRPAQLDMALREWERDRDDQTKSTYHWANRETRVDASAAPLFTEAMRTLAGNDDVEVSQMFSRLKNPEEVLNPRRASAWLARALRKVQSGERVPLLHHAFQEARADLDTRLDKRDPQFRAARRRASENRRGVEV